MNDTNTAVETRYREMLMRLPPRRRLEMADAMFTDAKKLVEESIRQQNGALTSIELKIEIFRRFYACDFSDHELSTIIDHLTRHPND